MMGSWQFLVFLGLQIYHSNLCLHLHMTSSLFLVSVSTFLIRTLVILDHPNDLILTWWLLQRPYFPDKVKFWDLGGLGLQHISYEGCNSIHKTWFTNTLPEQDLWASLRVQTRTNVHAFLRAMQSFFVPPFKLSTNLLFLYWLMSFECNMLNLCVSFYFSQKQNS